MSENSHTPLFLKYRPQRLEDLVGQESFTEIIRQTIEHNKLANAYLLTGPKGSGKTSSARILAKCLNCEGAPDQKSPTTKPCGKCPSCISITNSSSVDVAEIDAASHRGIEDARQLIEKVQLASLSGKYRVYIIDEVHMLTKEAFNTLLKVFEEPPEKTVFILATTEEDKVLPTIKSRCQQFRFRLINHKDCLKRLEEVARLEKINIEEEALHEIVKRSDGALRDALGLLDQISVFSEPDKAIGIKHILDLIGGIYKKDLEDLLISIVKKRPDELIKKLDEIHKEAKDPISLNKELSLYALDLLDSLSLGRPIPKEFQDIEDRYDLSQITTQLFDIEFKLKNSNQAKNILKANLIELAYRYEQKASPTNQTTSQELVSETKSLSKENHEKKLSLPDKLSPSSRGIFISSKAQLSTYNEDKATLIIPTKFKFLKTKIEDKAEEILEAISALYSCDKPKSLNIEIEEDSSETSPKEKNELENPNKKIPVEPYPDENLNSSKLDEIVRVGIQTLGAKEIKL
jgi:DNA polymerase III subunit gamma/tau